MLATFVIVFREIIEAGLIVGIVLAATRGVLGRSRFVASGIAAGVAGACVVAALAHTIATAMEGFGQEWFNIGVLCLAALMLIWHNAWMARHGREIAHDMKALGAAVSHGTRSMTALAVVVGLAVMREGSEVVLFLYGIVISSQDTALAMTLGGMLGLLGGVTISALMYFGLVHIPQRHLFKVTGILIALLAAGMASQAVALLEQAEVITIGSQVVWDSSGFIADNSVVGKVIHTLIGYTDRPTAMQLTVYLSTLVLIYCLMKLLKPVRPHQPAIASA